MTERPRPKHACHNSTQKFGIHALVHRALSGSISAMGRCPSVGPCASKPRGGKIHGDGIEGEGSAIPPGRDWQNRSSAGCAGRMPGPRRCARRTQWLQPHRDIRQPPSLTIMGSPLALRVMTEADLPFADSVRSHSRIRSPCSTPCPSRRRQTAIRATASPRSGMRRRSRSSPSAKAATPQGSSRPTLISC